jgi:tRNA(Ile)-lysidine synthase
LCQQISAQTSQVFHVIHIHHGLSANADHWAQQCRQWSDAAGFPFHLHMIAIDISGGVSLEEAARELRYQKFAETMQENDLLLTAHHQDDQAETILLQLLRGAGPKGLAAMPVMKSFARGFHGRPLLGFTRAELLAHAEARQLAWVEDESNADVKMTRNFIRHDVMSLLKTRWPNVESVLSRSAAHCAEAQVLLEEMASEKLLQISGSKPDTLSVTKLLELSEAWQRLLLRAWIEQHGFSLPDTNKILSIQSSVLRAAQDRMPCVTWQGAEVRRHRDDLHIMQPQQQPLTLPSVEGLTTDIGTLIVRFRIDGETVTIGNRGKVALKNLFQEWGVPVWERSTIPLIFCGDKLVQVPGYFIDPTFIATEQ